MVIVLSSGLKNLQNEYFANCFAMDKGSGAQIAILGQPPTYE